MNLTIIYLGSKLPKYVIKNLKYLNSTFPNEEIYFISDSRKSLNRAKKVGIKTWLAPNPEKIWHSVYENLDHPMEFRSGFWFKTFARIFVIGLFMQDHPDQSCLQIEADVLIFPNFPLSNFENLEEELAFPMESEKMGIASILFIKNRSVASKLTQLGIQAAFSDNKMTDMKFLGEIANSKAFNFFPLQTLPASMNVHLNKVRDINLFCKDTYGLNGIFDGITLGQYLLGIDPRNSRGLRIIYRKQPSHAINPENLDFSLNSDGNLLLNDGEKSFEIYNLHNHAKDLRIYKRKTRDRLLLERIGNSGNVEQREFVTSAFIGGLTRAIWRKMKWGASQSKRN